MEITVGIAQTPNSLSLEKNFESIFSLLVRFEAHEVDLIVFPECALSGFSAKMNECTQQALKPYQDKIAAWVRMTGKEVVLPTAIAKNGQVYNSGWWFKTDGIHDFYKTGLTDSEKKFFAVPKHPPSKIFQIKGFTFAILICFEAELKPWAHFNPGEVDAVLWPGYWGWDLESKWTPEKESGKQNKIFQNIQEWKLPVLQANFAYNDLNGHQGAGPEGLSFIINANNELVHKGAHKKADGMLIKLLKDEDGPMILDCKALI